MGADRNGLANEYYGAAVRSMTESWHAFLFGSFDAAACMTVDKPPLALWVQALSARAFGFSSLALLVPQALMGVATVGLAYDLTRRRFGRAAGFAAGLVLALTPITVAISRHNNPDALLVLCCAAALWAVVRGLEDGRTRWLVLAGVASASASRRRWPRRCSSCPGSPPPGCGSPRAAALAAVRQLLAGGAALVVVGGAWPVLVCADAGGRPALGLRDRRQLDLVADPRLQRPRPPRPARPAGPAAARAARAAAAAAASSAAHRPAAAAQRGARRPGRLAARLRARRRRSRSSSRRGLRRGDARTGWMIAVGGAFASRAVAFSYAPGIFHPYYVSPLAPFTAALVGGGGGRARCAAGASARIVGPVVVAGGVVAELVVLDDTGGRPGWLPPRRDRRVGAAIAASRRDGLRAADARGRGGTGAGRAAARARVLVRPDARPRHERDLPGRRSGRRARRRLGGPRRRRPGGGPAAAAGGALGGAPAAAAGPPGGRAAAAGCSAATPHLTEALAYARAHGGGTVAVSSQPGAASAIIESGADVAGIGGFSGRESQVSVALARRRRRDGQHPLGARRRRAAACPQDGRTGATAVMDWVQSHGKRSPSSGLYDLSNFSGTSQASS